MSAHRLVRVGWLLDGTGGPILRDVLLEMGDERITAIQDAKDDQPGSRLSADFADCTLVPGLVDSHCHLFMSGTANPHVRERQLQANFQSMREVIARHIRQQVAHGIVAVRDGGDYGGHALRYKQQVLSDQPTALRMMVAGKAWRAAGRYGRLIGRPPERGFSLTESILREHEGIDHIKIVNSGLNSLLSYGKQTSPQFTAGELKEAVAAARRLRLKTMIHANGRHPVRAAIEAGCQSIEHGFFMGAENIAKMAERGVVWVPTACTMKAYAETLSPKLRESEIAKRNFDHQITQLSKAQGYGVSIALGTDAGSLGVHHGEAMSHEIEVLLSAGFSLEKAIQCATWNGAVLLGIERELGKLTPGMPATFLVAKGPPQKLPRSLRSPQEIWVRGARQQLLANRLSEHV
jgi:imidazolonepropionase-like amidohydrolase